MAWFVYIVECSDKSYYTGITYDLMRRVRQHNEGVFRNFTKSRMPVKLVYWRKHVNRVDAALEEKIIKGWSRFKKARLISSLRRAKRDGGSSVG